MIALALAAALAPAPAAADIGPEPTMEAFVALAEPALLSQMKKPRPVTFVWPYRLAAVETGYFTCGRVDSKSARGEEIWVSAVVAGGAVVSAQWSTKNGMLAWDCKNQVKKGVIRP
jgi:hypothetical protein